MKLPLMSILGVCLMALINGCSQPRETSPVPRSVKVVVPETIEAVTTRQFNGVLQERDRSDLAFRVGGPLERIFVNEGDYVKSGETLALIDSRDYEINLRVAEAKYKQAKAKYERYQELFKQDKIPANTFEKFESAWRATHSNYEKAKNALADTRLKAPFSGYIFQKHISRRETIAPGASAFTLISKELEMTFGVSETMITKIKIQSEATIYSGETSIPATVKSVSTKSGADNLYEVRLAIAPQNSKTVLPGMSAKASVNISENKKAITMTVPVEAVFYQKRIPHVWAVNVASSKVTIRSVKTGHLRSDGKIEILGGLDGHEIIVSAGAHTLREDQPVKLLSINADKISH